MVKCKYCLQIFDKDTEPHTKIGNRYVHKTCLEKKEGGKTYKDITNLVSEIFPTQNINWPLIGKQIKNFSQAGIKYSEMYYALVYFFKVKKNKTEKSKGVGIIPYVYQEAEQYFQIAQNNYALRKQIENNEKNLFENKIEEIEIIKKPKKKRLKNLDY